MKIHEIEEIDSNFAGSCVRQAVPGGWNYIYFKRTTVHNVPGVAVPMSTQFVPDPTAEHVTESAANVAAAVGANAGYAKAIADCWEMLDSELKADSASPAYRMKLLSKFKALAARNATSQTGEG